MNIKSNAVLLYQAQDLKSWRESLSRKDARPLIGFVPTMGFLHEGHLSLIKEAKRHAQYVIVSIFVNPSQFNDASDFEHYPRNEEQDIYLASQAGADAIFLPSVEVIYPHGAQTWVNVGALGDTLCGASRPGHFQGVCTVVTALFNLVGCQVAVFGEKDYQQLAIIRRMTQDLHLPVKIIGLATFREANGLAMSSHNARLSPQARQEASGIYSALQEAQNLWRQGQTSLLYLEQRIKEALPTCATIDYLSFCEPHSLQLLERLEQAHDPSQPVLIAIACFVEKVRLIDNLILAPLTSNSQK